LIKGIQLLWKAKVSPFFEDTTAERQIIKAMAVKKIYQF
jgi:hypothetical protein